METLDLTGLKQDDVELLKKLVDFLRTRTQQQEVESTAEAVQYHSWPLGVKGKITREEIYDYL